MPSLSTTREGYLLREHNCPVMRLAVAQPEVCDTIHTRCMRQGDPFSDYVIATAPQHRGPVSDDGKRKAAKTLRARGRKLVFRSAVTPP